MFLMHFALKDESIFNVQNWLRSFPSRPGPVGSFFSPSPSGEHLSVEALAITFSWRVSVILFAVSLDTISPDSSAPPTEYHSQYCAPIRRRDMTTSSATIHLLKSLGFAK